MHCRNVDKYLELINIRSIMHCQSGNILYIYSFNALYTKYLIKININVTLCGDLHVPSNYVTLITLQTISAAK